MRLLRPLRSFLKKLIVCSILVMGGMLLEQYLWGKKSWSQVLPDQTTSTQVESCGSGCIDITGGARGEQNLFHSFHDFNVRRGQSVQFSPSSDVHTIFSRVTGRNPSHIRGLLGVAGSADLVILNPNGIFFGSHAQLNMGMNSTTEGGSFTATTANAIQFHKQGQFSTTHTQQNLELLTISPSAFLFNVSKPQPIRYRPDIELANNNTELNVQGEETLRFVGGPISLQAGRLNARKIELVAVNGPAAVSLTSSGLNVPEDTNFADITFSNGAGLLAQSGHVNMIGHDITLRQGSRVDVGTSINLPAGTINVFASGTIYSQGVDPSQRYNAGFFAPSSVSSSSNAGMVRINTGSLVLEDGAQIVTSTQTTQSAGRIIVNAEDSIRITGTVTISNNSNLREITSRISSSSSRSSGRSGNIVVNSNSLTLQNGAGIFTRADNLGDAGRIDINVRQLVLQNEAKIFSEVGGGASDGGNILIQGLANNPLDLISLSERSEISTSVGGDGTGGNITVEADFLVANYLGNSDITANADGGPGGRIELTLAGGLFNIAPRSQTELGLGLDPIDFLTNDITAISKVNPRLDGDVIVRTPDVDPDRRLPELPGQLEVPKLRQQCYGDRASSSSTFINAGQGGLPPTPNHTHTTLNVWEDLRPLTPELSSEYPSSTSMVQPMPTRPARTPMSIAEAQGWTIGTKGEVILTAHAHPETSDIPQLPSPSFCRPS